ncbi:MAG: sigma-70 family RNA polymerase sigma factor [Myxococcota bacterium]
MADVLLYARVAPRLGADVNDRDGTQSELEELYRRYGPSVHRRCLGLLGDADEAMDAVQDVFLKVEHNLRRFRRESEPMTWLYRIATNHCLNRLRDRAVRERHASNAAPQHVGESSGLAGAIDARRALSRLLARFALSDVQLLLHRHGDEMTQLEIAAVLGISERTVRDRLKRLEAAAREELGMFEGLWRSR